MAKHVTWLEEFEILKAEHRASIEAKQGGFDEVKRERLAYLSMRYHRMLQNEYGPVHDWLKGLLYRHDLEGLTGPGTQYDEYSVEAEQLLPILREMYRKKEVDWVKVESELRKVFRHYPAGKFDAAAQEIADFLNGKKFVIDLENTGALNFL
jgi:hypothetical protein